MAEGHAVSVETEVIPEKGLWAVDIVVIFTDGVVRRRVDTYRTKALATISAKYIKRAAERDISGPING
jgi:hypothetical protein